MTRKPSAATPEEQKARVRKAFAMIKGGYDLRTVEKRTGSTVIRLKAWAQELGLVWPGKQRGKKGGGQ